MERTQDVKPEILRTEDGAEIAYHRLPGRAPGIIFLGGFASDMTGTKAQALAAFAQARGQAFVRFDYQGHGQSSGRFEDGTIGQWSRDGLAVLDHLSEGPQILVGSSMGGWIMLLVALARRERVAGLLGIAAAPDFTEELIWDTLDAGARARIQHDGVYHMPSEYGEPLPVTRQLVEEGRSHLLLRGVIPLTCPVRLLQGMDDDDVPWRHALKLQAALESGDVTTVLIKGGDHRLSAPHELERLRTELGRLLDQDPPEPG